jgi:Fe-S-cluster containining protein
MGEAKRRRAEIERLKALSPEDAAVRRQEQEDEAALRGGIDPKAATAGPAPVIAMARRLHGQFAQAKAAGNVDDAIRYLYGKIDATLDGLRDIPIACGKGCSHCCVIAVTVSAPEALYVGKQVAALGPQAIARVRAANEVTRHIDLLARDRHPHDCPMLQDHACTIYAHRPKACRQAASTDALACERSNRQLSREAVPSPAGHIGSRTAYAMALYAALAQAALPSDAYEFNAALVRVFDTPDAEARWLAGEDIFAGVPREPPTPKMYAERIAYVRQRAFGAPAP